MSAVFHLVVKYCNSLKTKLCIYVGSICRMLGCILGFLHFCNMQWSLQGIANIQLLKIQTSEGRKIPYLYAGSTLDFLPFIYLYLHKVPWVMCVTLYFFSVKVSHSCWTVKNCVFYSLWDGEQYYPSKKR